MLAILHSLVMFVAVLFKPRCRLEAENLFLRHHLSIALRRAPPRLRLRGVDRALLVWMTRLWPSLLGAAQVVQPETILRWHRAGFTAFWRPKFPKASRAAEDRSWPARSHPTDQQGKPAVGRVPDPWRTLDAGVRGCSVDGLQIHGAGSVAVARLEDILPEPPAADRGHRPV